MHAVLCPMQKIFAFQVGTNLSVYSGVDTGLLRCQNSLFTTVDSLLKRMSYCTMTDILQSFASRGALSAAKTNGLTWFNVETEASAVFTRASLDKIGLKHEMHDGRSVHIVGLPKHTQVSPSTGGNWAEFTVESWRSAVYTCESYFSQVGCTVLAYTHNFPPCFVGEKNCFYAIFDCIFLPLMFFHSLFLNEALWGHHTLCPRLDPTTWRLRASYGCGSWLRNRRSSGSFSRQVIFVIFFFFFFFVGWIIFWVWNKKQTNKKLCFAFLLLFTIASARNMLLVWTSTSISLSSVAKMFHLRNKIRFA
jgi:hypothetical protein